MTRVPVQNTKPKTDYTETTTTTIITTTPLPEVKDPAAIALLGTDLMTANLPQDIGLLLPGLKFVWPIDLQSNPDVFKPAHIGTIGLNDGKKYEPLAAPYILSAIASRNMVRRLNDTKDGGKEYERAYGSMGGKPGKSMDAYTLGCKEGWDQGASFILAVITGAGVSIVEFQCFKTLTSYLGRPLSTTSVKARTGMEIQTADHNGNFTVGKRGFGYPDSKKFKQWRPVELKPEQAQAIAAALAAPDTMKRVLAWMEA